MLLEMQGWPSFAKSERRKRPVTMFAWSAAAGLLYFLAARLSLPFSTPAGIAEFWPAAGVAVGLLAVGGRPATVAVAAAVAAASFLANWLYGVSIPACFAFALGNTGEALMVSALIERQFARPFELDRLQSVLGLFAAAAIGTAVWEAATALMLDFASINEVSFWLLWSRLFWANFTGIVTAAPLAIGLAAAVRNPPGRRELIEGTAVLALHAGVSLHAFALQPGQWMQAAPFASQLPVLLWLSVRCGPLFAAAGSLVLGFSSLGSFATQTSRFGDLSFPLAERLAMHFAMLAISFVALAIAALIAERRNAENAARDSEARLKLSLEAGNFGTWELDTERGLFHASGTARRCFGLPPSFPVTLPAVLAMMHPADRQHCEKLFRRVGAGTADLDTECRALRPDGSVRWLHLMGRAADGGESGWVAGAVRDITEQKSLASLRESAEQLRLFIEHAPVAIAMFDRDMRYLAASQRWVSDHGLRQKGLTGRPYYELLPVIPEVWKEAHRRAMAGEVIRAEEDRFERPDGATQWLRWEVRPWRTASGAIGGIVIFTEDVTGRVETERALSDSLDDLDRAQAVARTGSWRLDLKRNKLTWSAEACRIYGVSSDWMPAYESFLSMVHPEDRASVDRAWQAALGGAVYDIEYRILTQGTTKWVRARAELEFDSAGSLRGGFGTVQDITDKKQAEEELLRQQRLTLLIGDRAADAIFVTDGNGCITYANPEAERTFGFTAEEMMGNELHALLHHHRPDGTALPRDNCPLSRIQEAGETIRNHQDVFFHKDGAPLEVSCSFAPMEQGRKESGGVFVVRDITAQKAAEKALRESEQRLRVSNEAGGIGTFTVDLETGYAYYSPEMAQIVGFPGMDAAKVEDAFARVHREDAARVRATYVRGLAGANGGQIRMDFRFVRPGGEVRWMTWNGRVDFRQDAGGRTPYRIMGACVDITERKRAEEATAQLAAIVASSSDAIIGMTLDGTITSWNEAAGRLFGYIGKEMIGQTIHRLIPPERQREEDGLLAEVSAGGVVANYETVRLHKSGDPVEVSVTVSPIRDPAGKVTGASKIAHDISKRKRAEAALRHSEERFRGIFENAGTGITISDIDGRFQSCNRAFSAMLGYTEEELKRLNALDVKHPDDRERNKEEIRQLLSGEIPSFQMLCRFIRRDGKLIWVHKYVSVLKDASGRPAGIITLVTDISERKRHDEKVHLLLREVNHRAKNVLALVQAIASRTAAPDHAEFIKRFSERLSALAASQDLLVSSGWQGVEIAALARSQLSHFKNLIDDRINLFGPPLNVSAPAAQTMGMALHELATNAGKYGALSTPSGQIDISWGLARGPAGEERFELTWCEHGGPAVTRPKRTGFGTTVIETIPRMELDATVTLLYEPEGLRWCLACPAGNVLEVADTGMAAQ